MPERSATGWLRRLLFLALIAIVGWYGWLKFKEYEAAHPELFPWTELSLTDPVGPYTDDKLAALAPAQCTALLGELGLGDATGILRTASEAQCGYDDGVRLGSAGRPDYGDLTVSCSVAAALSLWERETVQPAAARHFGSDVVSIETFGSYSCRRLYGRSEGAWSEHATANAIDIAAFRLADGTRISVLEDWGGSAERANFLRDVRDGACACSARRFRPTITRPTPTISTSTWHAAGRPAGRCAASASRAKEEGRSLLATPLLGPEGQLD